ncbi:hypothetical protein [Geobacillus stearothermophilus]|uniref:hypothetical protein n=1 Tax=Geobacillus stearothermophilus TaxID=1422 RepID=UPI00066FEBBC|nr:hypothetical protein [Geobacillus stearothermophilus]KMY58716.1 hypothetical protein AA904_11795 [Geobacillus stearothermophilus]KMY60329.1 hypothetical protein AA905_10465 [Geobacillus stearothermophilus]
MLKRSIKFPLIMKSGAKVRTIEELRANFDLESVMELFFDGRLKVWLEQRFYKNELEQLERIKDIPIEEAETIAKRLFEIFNIPFSEDHLDVNYIIKKRQKIEMLKQFTNEQIENVDQVATSQEELCKILENSVLNNETTVYLLGDIFEVSDKYSHVQYVGLNNPKVKLLCEGTFNAKQKGISFANLVLTSDTDIRFKPGTNSNVTFEGKNISLQKGDFNNLIGSIKIDYSQFGDSGFSDGHRNIFVYENTIVVRKGKCFVFYDLNSGKGINQFKSNFFGYDDIKAFREKHMFYILDYEKVDGPGNRYKSVLYIFDLNNPYKMKKQELDLIWNEGDVNAFGNITIEDNKLFINEISNGFLGTGDVSYYSYSINLNNLSIISSKSYRKINMKLKDLRAFSRNENDCFSIYRQQLYYIPSYGAGELFNPKSFYPMFKIGMKSFKIASDKIFAVPLKGNQRNVDGGLYFGSSPFPLRNIYSFLKNEKDKEGEIAVFDLNTGNKIADLPTPPFYFMNVVDRYLVTARVGLKREDGTEKPGEISIWDTDTLEKLSTIQVPGLFDWSYEFDIDVSDDKMAILYKDQVFVYGS